MGARKHNTAQVRKEALKTQYFAKLNNLPSSPRKMRLVADMIRSIAFLQKRSVYCVGKITQVGYRKLGKQNRLES